MDIQKLIPSLAVVHVHLFVAPVVYAFSLSLPGQPFGPFAAFIGVFHVTRHASHLFANHLLFNLAKITLGYLGSIVFVFYGVRCVQNLSLNQ